MSARARILTQTFPSVLVAPLRAVVERSGERVVFFVEDGRAHAVSVAGETIHEDRILLSSSLPFRELVVRGQRNLRDGSSVRVDNTILDQTGEL